MTCRKTANRLNQVSIIALLFLCGCGGGSPSSQTQVQTPTKAAITPANATLQQWATQTFVGHVFDQDGNEITSLPQSLYSFDWEPSATSTGNTAVLINSPYSRTAFASAGPQSGTITLTFEVLYAANGYNPAVDLTANTNVTVTSDPIASVTISGNWTVSAILFDSTGGAVPYDEIIPEALIWYCTYLDKSSCANALTANSDGSITLPTYWNPTVIPSVQLYALYASSSGNVVSNTLTCNAANRECQ